MRLPTRLVRAAIPRTAKHGDLAVVNSIESFLLAPGHRMRGSACLLCHLVIGGKRAAVIGLAGLAGDACICSGISGHLFIIHAEHFPVEPAVIETALRRGVSCTAYHPAHH